MISKTTTVISNKPQSYTAKNKPSFGNSYITGLLSADKVTNGLEILKQSPIAEIVALDIGTMAAPRIAIESTQNPDYGIESSFRELVPIALNPFGPGIVASVLLMMSGFSGINLGSKTVEGLHNAWKSAGGEKISTEKPQEEIVKKYTTNVLEATKGFISIDGTTNEFKKLTEAETESISKKLTDIILGKHDNKKNKELLKEAKEEFVAATGTENSLKVHLIENNPLEANAKSLFEDVTAIGKKLFIKVEHGNLNTEIDKLKNLTPHKTFWGATLSIIGLCSLPSINNYLTKKRTGKDGYCAYKDFTDSKNQHTKSPEAEKKEKSRLWKAKALSTAGMALIMVASMGGFGKKGFFREGGLKNFKDKIEMKGKNAGMDLVRLMYGSSLMSRILFSRDEQEVKVTTVRDYSGFLNWLVLGPFVAKGIAHLADKKGSMLNISGPIIEGKNPIKWVGNWLNNVSMKSHGEMEAMLKKLPEEVRLKEAPIKRAIFNGSIMGGIAYSMFMLGVGMPSLTNYMTNRAREKQLKQKEQNPQSDLITNNKFFEKNKIVFGEFLPKNSSERNKVLV